MSELENLNLFKSFIIISCFFFHIETQQQFNIIHNTTTLSEARYQLAATSSGELVFFAGGLNSTGPSDRVDIYNVTSGSWTTTTLSIPRSQLAATSSQNLVFFGGGWIGGISFSNQVDIYNTLNGSWSTATLSQSRCLLAATSVGNFVFFGGGNNLGPFNVVDVFDVTNNTWTTAILSQPRFDLASTSVDNRYALFGGGGDAGSDPSNVVDIFDSLSGSRSTTTLSQARRYLAATSVGKLAFFGGGETNGYQPSNVVDIFNSTSQTWNTSRLNQARRYLSASSIGEIVAFGGGSDGSTYSSSVVDMFDVTSNTWFTVTLSQSRSSLASTSSTNKILFGGGFRSSGESFNVVDIFEIPLPPPSFIPFNSLVPSISTNYPITNMTSNFSQNDARVNVGPETSSSGDVLGIVGIVIGSVLTLIGLGLIVLIVLIKRKKREHNLELNENISTTQQKRETVVIESVQNTITSFDETNTNTTTFPTYQPETETLKGLSPSRILFNELEIGNEIGSGTYGRVCIGKWKTFRIALKFCQNNGKIDEFMREANLMISLPPHPNVVQMFGVCIDGPQPIIIMEYYPGGSLDKLLKDKRQKISEEQKFRLIHEIAFGMCHLHKFNIVHRDLAARNILLTEPTPNAQPKISDFGMSRVLKGDIYGRTKNGFGPVCWMAPESIERQVYSKKSDVWMFGILVYEIVSRSEPHVGRNPLDVAVAIRDKGLTPEIPSNCPQKLGELMQMCWKKQSQQRPSFEMICEFLEK